MNTNGLNRTTSLSSTFFFRNLLLLFLISSCGLLVAQSEEYQKNSSIELNVGIIGGRISESNMIEVPSLFFARDSINYTSSYQSGPIIQVKFVRAFSENFSLYASLLYGADIVYNNVILRDSTSGFASFAPADFLSPPDYQLKHFAFSTGARVSLPIFKNDKINFSVGGKVQVYPKQRASNSLNHFSSVREEEALLNSSVSLENQGNAFLAFEAGLSYNLITKSGRFKYIAGLTGDNNASVIASINNTVELPRTGSVFDFNFKIGGGSLGAYVGFAYVLGKKKLPEGQ